MQSLLSVNPHNMFARRWIVRASALMTVGILSLAPGCADEQTPTPLPERLQKLESDLTLVLPRTRNGGLKAERDPAG